MKRTGLIVTLAVMALCASAFAVTYNNANLEGNYAFMLSRADWACVSMNIQGHCTANGTAQRGVLGELTFDGIGSLSGSYWIVIQGRGGTWTTQTGTVTGNYSVVAPGLAQLTVTPSGSPKAKPVTIFVSLSNFDTPGVAHGALLLSPDKRGASVGRMERQ